MQPLIVLELNEVNFEHLKIYASKGLLPNFRKLFETHGYAETTSEVNYVELEPWIQWVTAHTGKTFAEHQIFRLGDAVNSKFPQIWEQLENERGISVAAICPMNAANRLSKAAFFVPDPWTKTRIDGPWALRLLSPAIAQAVNDNADGRITASSIARLLVGIFAYARVRNYLRYLSLVARLPQRPWNKVLFLDLFLGDVLISLFRSKRPAFCTIFLNGAAHLQHHYMYSSRGYDRGERNPDWYIKPSMDPVGDIYMIYDTVLGQIQESLPDCRLMIATGLHQDPTRGSIHYWRPRNHGRLLDRLGVRFKAIDPRMSRDFLVSFDTAEDCGRAKALLDSVVIGAEKVFASEQRTDQNELFVELVYPHDIAADAAAMVGNVVMERFREEVAFVALKNGQHNSIGYFLDSARAAGISPVSMPLTDVHSEMMAAFQVAAE